MAKKYEPETVALVVEKMEPTEYRYFEPTLQNKIAREISYISDRDSLYSLSPRAKTTLMSAQLMALDPKASFVIDPDLVDALVRARVSSPESYKNVMKSGATPIEGRLPNEIIIEVERRTPKTSLVVEAVSEKIANLKKSNKEKLTGAKDKSLDAIVRFFTEPKMTGKMKK